MYSSLADSIHADSLTRRNAKKQLPLIVKLDYKYTSGFKREVHISLLSIRVFEALGLDTAPCGKPVKRT